MCADMRRPERDYLARLRPKRLDVSDAYGASGRRIFFLMKPSSACLSSRINPPVFHFCLLKFHSSSSSLPDPSNWDRLTRFIRSSTHRNPQEGSLEPCHQLRAVLSPAGNPLRTNPASSPPNSGITRSLSPPFNRCSSL